MTENWRPVVGFEAAYEVSDAGRVRSLDRAWWQAGRNGRAHLRRQAGRVLKPGASKSGHLTVVLGRGNTRQVHDLVMSAFQGLCPMGSERRHLNGDPTDNRSVNLKYGTRGENMEDRARHGNYKLTPDDVSHIRSSRERGIVLAARFDCSKSQISNIRRGLQRVNT